MNPELLEARILPVSKDILREGEIDRRIFGFKSDAPASDYRNPVLMAGDVVRLRESIASAGIEILNEITAPAVGLYSVYSIYRDVQP